MKSPKWPSLFSSFSDIRMLILNPYSATILKSPPIVFGFRSSGTLSSSSTMILHLRSFSSCYRTGSSVTSSYSLSIFFTAGSALGSLATSFSFSKSRPLKPPIFEAHYELRGRRFANKKLKLCSVEIELCSNHRHLDPKALIADESC
jgi:hypothetical protein